MRHKNGFASTSATQAASQPTPPAQEWARARCTVAFTHPLALQAALLDCSCAVPASQPPAEMHCTACLTSSTRDGQMKLYKQASCGLPTPASCPGAVVSPEQLAFSMSEGQTQVLHGYQPVDWPTCTGSERPTCLSGCISRSLQHSSPPEQGKGRWRCTGSPSHTRWRRMSPTPPAPQGWARGGPRAHCRAPRGRGRRCAQWAPAGGVPARA